MDQLELFVLEFAKIAESDFVYTLASTNVDQLVPNMITIYMTIRYWMSLIMGQNNSNVWSYLPLNKEKLFDFVYTLASTNNDHLAPNLVKMYGTVIS